MLQHRLGFLFFLLAILSIVFAIEQKENPRKLTETRVVGGEDVVPTNRFPYFVSIQRTDNQFHFCGGVLIAPDIVLTAEICGRGRASLRYVRTNAYDIMNPDTSSETIPVADVVRHPFRRQPTDAANNFAIVKLAFPSVQPVVTLNTDSAVPMTGERLTTIGHGNTVYALPSPPDVLQSTEVTYITNTECILLTTGGVLGDYNGFLTDDAMCARNSRNGPCNGDEGGPLLQTGNNGEDLLVGIVTIVPICTQIQYPAIYSRISSHYEFIRTFVCGISTAPPASFDCANATTFSPRPTPSPMMMPTVAPVTAAPITPEPSLVPTVTGKPSATPITVTVVLSFDGFPLLRGWGLVRAGGPEGEFEVLRQPGTYSPFVSFTKVTEEVTLDSGVSYFLVVFGDSFQESRGLYFAAVVLGSDVSLAPGPLDSSAVLAYTETTTEGISVQPFLASPLATFGVTLSPTAAPSISAAPSASAEPTLTQVTVTVLIQTDLVAFQIGWSIIDTATGQAVAGVNPGVYQTFEAGRAVTETVSLDMDRVYLFLLIDVGLDGIQNQLEGFAAVFLGEQPTPDQLLAFIPGNFDGVPFQQALFRTSEDGVITLAPTGAPSAAPSVTPVLLRIVIQLDANPTEFGLVIGPASLGAAPILQFPVGSLTIPNERIERIVGVPPGQQLLLSMQDRGGNGICCDAGNGFVAIFAEDDTVLVMDNGQFRFNRFTLFSAPNPNSPPPTPAPITAAPVTPAPTAPTPAPTLQRTPFPTPMPSPAPVTPMPSSMPSKLDDSDSSDKGTKMGTKMGKRKSKKQNGERALRRQGSLRRQA